MIAAKLLIAIVLVFMALCLVCAVMVARPRLRRGAYDMPGFSPEQCETIARRRVELHHTPDGVIWLRRSVAGSGSVSRSSPPMPLPANFNARRLFNPPAPTRPTFGRGRRAF